MAQPGPSTSGFARVQVDLPFRPPLHVAGLFGHLVASAVPGVEEWRDGAYRRTVRLPSGPGVVELPPPADGRTVVRATMYLADPADESDAIRMCRRLLDLDADPAASGAALRGDPALRPLVDAVPGRRVPGSPDPAEFALRTVLGQQVSVAAARTHAARLARDAGVPIDDPAGGLTVAFPTAAAVAAVDPGVLALPQRRRATLLGLAAALAEGTVVLDDSATARAGLAGLPGIGPWTVECVAMRALGDPDAFPASDLGLLAASAQLGLGDTARVLAGRAEAWRPYRSYATQYLWGVLPHAVNRHPAIHQRATTRT